MHLDKTKNKEILGTASSDNQLTKYTTLDKDSDLQRYVLISYSSITQYELVKKPDEPVI